MAIVKAMRRLKLTEHERYRCQVPLTLEQRKALSDAHISVSASQSEEGTYELTPSSYVGVVNTGDLSAIIRPKVEIDRVIFMITYAMDPRHWNMSEFIELKQEEDVLEAIALSFTHRTKQAVGRGLLRGYRREEDTLNTVRGQIRFSDQIRRRYDLPLPIEVAYDEYTEDIEQNRLLKTALYRLSLARIRNKFIADEIRRLRSAFDMVQLGTYTAGAVPKIRHTRLDEHYRPAVDLARFIIENSSPELSSGNVPTSSFLVNMNEVFERFVYVAIGETQTLGLDRSGWRSKQAIRLYRDRPIHVEPDLSWWGIDPTTKKHRPYFVGDAKYKNLGTVGFRHGDMYQMLAFCTAARLSYGLLIYAKGEGDPGKYQVKNANITIEVLWLDLSVPPQQILTEVDRLAEHIGAHARASLDPAALSEH